MVGVSCFFALLPFKEWDIVVISINQINRKALVSFGPQYNLLALMAISFSALAPTLVKCYEFVQ